MLGQGSLRRSSAVRQISLSPIAGILFRMLLMALLSRARLSGELSPFAPACFAAALAHGHSPVPLLLGCAAGCLTMGISLINALPLIACAAVCLFYIVIRLIALRFPVLNELHDLCAALCAGAGLLATGLYFSGHLLYNIITCAVGSAVAALLAPSLVSALGIRLSRRSLMQEEQLSLALLMLLLLCGVRALPYAGSFLSTMLAALLTLFCSSAGCGMGAMCGIAIGTALTLSGSHPFIGSSLSLCGLLAGVVRSMPRPCAAAVFALGNTLTVSWGMGWSIGAMDMLPLLTGASIYCLLPRSLLYHLRAWLCPRESTPDIERMSGRLRRQAAQRLDELSDVFGELADGYGEKQTLPGEQQIILQLRRALCEGCEGFAVCWQGDQPQAGRLMCRLMAEGLQGRAPTPISEIPPDLLRHCRRSSQIESRMMPLLTRLSHQRRNELKRGESRALLGTQFRQAQKALNELSTRMKSELCIHQEYAEMARAALDRAGIPVQNVTALLDDRLEFICILKSGIWDAERARIAARLLSDELGVPFSPVLSHGRVIDECELRLLQAPALTASIAAVCAPAQEDMPCGDSHIACLLPDGRLLAAISDGMGHGEQAAEESRRCISLLRKFVCAGLDRDAALSSVNRLLLLRGGDEMFATADLCVVNLYSGIASFSKLAANRTFILQEKQITQITGGRLPLGILDHIEPANAGVEVYPGDVIIMTSDGIADELKDGQMDELQKYLLTLRMLPTEEIAARILAWAQTRTGERDDMTAVVSRMLSRR